MQYCFFIPRILGHIVQSKAFCGCFCYISVTVEFFYCGSTHGFFISFSIGTGEHMFVGVYLCNVCNGSEFNIVITDVLIIPYNFVESTYSIRAMRKLTVNINGVTLICITIQQYGSSEHGCLPCELSRRYFIFRVLSDFLVCGVYSPFLCRSAFCCFICHRRFLYRLRCGSILCFCCRRGIISPYGNICTSLWFGTVGCNSRFCVSAAFSGWFGKRSRRHQRNYHYGSQEPGQKTFA